MKTNRKDFRIDGKHGEFIYTKRQANKRNRKISKKCLTVLV